MLCCASATRFSVWRSTNIRPLDGPWTAKATNESGKVLEMIQRHSAEASEATAAPHTHFLPRVS